MPFEANPRLVFERMFRGRTPVVPNWSRQARPDPRRPKRASSGESLERSVLDLVLDQAERSAPRPGPGRPAQARPISGFGPRRSKSGWHSSKPASAKTCSICADPGTVEARRCPRICQAEACPIWEDHPAHRRRSGKARRLHPP